MSEINLEDYIFDLSEILYIKEWFVIIFFIVLGIKLLFLGLVILY